MDDPGIELNFEKTDKETWLREIINEIGEPALDEVKFTIDPDWGVLPFRHADDVESRSSIRSRADHLGWKILEQFGTTPEDHEVVLTSLKGGCESLVFDAGKLPADKLSELLEGVYASMVDIHLQTVHAHQLQHMVSAIAQWKKPDGEIKEKSGGSIRWLNPEISGASDIDVLTTHLQQLHVLYPGMKGVCWEFPFSDYTLGLSGPMAKSFGRVVNALDMIEDTTERRKVLEKSVIRVTIGQDYFREIIRLRAIRLLWYNLMHSHGLGDQDIYLEANFHPGHYTRDTEKNMIKAGTMAMSAILGGADAVFILPADANPFTRDTRLRRIARNIHHLFRFESHLEKHTDPVRGAYFFESIVPELVRKVWKMSLE